MQWSRHLRSVRSWWTRDFNAAGTQFTGKRVISNGEKKQGANHMYAVMGITGNVGGAVARTLLARGEKVRGIVRNPEKAKSGKSRASNCSRLTMTMRKR
jgi:predicted amino acid dehydrogenase